MKLFTLLESNFNYSIMTQCRLAIQPGSRRSPIPRVGSCSICAIPRAGSIWCRRKPRPLSQPGPCWQTASPMSPLRRSRRCALATGSRRRTTGGMTAGSHRGGFTPQRRYGRKLPKQLIKVPPLLHRDQTDLPLIEPSGVAVSG